MMLRRHFVMFSKARQTGLALLVFGMLWLVACGQTPPPPASRPLSAEERAWQHRTPDGPWSQGVGYSLFLRSFADSDGDGKGDLRGATARLDYLAELGVRNIWLLPINASPSYHKYDVTDYEAIDTTYGTMEDFERFLAEAHRRGIRVTMDYVINHTSVRHPWFQSAVALGPKSPYYEWYEWQSPNDTVRRNWHRLRDQPERPRYYGFFWRGMPDLNYDQVAVRREMLRLARYWLDRGVDGFRLDAALHIYNADVPGNRVKSIAFWRELRDSLRASHPSVYLIGEVWDSQATVRSFYNGLDGCFNFALSDTLVKLLQRGEDPARLRPWLAAYQASLPVGSVDCTFLTNHDQTRIASRLGVQPAALRKAAEALLTLPGMPWLYYGEELGMPGVKPDPHIREPFVWGADTMTTSRSTTWIGARHAVPDSVNAYAVQRADSTSLYWHYRRLISNRAGPKQP